jgi:hypothetical protein
MEKVGDDSMDPSPTSPTRAASPTQASADDGMHVDQPAAAASGDTAKANDIPHYLQPTLCTCVIEDLVFFEC